MEPVLATVVNGMPGGRLVVIVQLDEIETIQGLLQGHWSIRLFN